MLTKTHLLKVVCESDEVKAAGAAAAAVGTAAAAGLGSVTFVTATATTTTVVATTSTTAATGIWGWLGYTVTQTVLVPATTTVVTSYAIPVWSIPVGGALFAYGVWRLNTAIGIDGPQIVRIACCRWRGGFGGAC